MAEEPFYRTHDMEAPEYGDDSDKFTIQITHNGFFVGLRGDVEYASSTTDWFDNCNRDTFSLLWIEDFLKQLGHPDNGRTHVYWMRPGIGIEEGLICIENDAHILMLTEAAKEHKTISLIVDHTNFLKNIRQDVIAKVGPEPTEPSRPPEPSLLVEQISEDGEDETDTEFYDSDWNVEDGDDDIFAANVDKEVNDNNEPVEIVEAEDDAGLEHEDIQLSIEQQHELQYKFSLFNPEVDMENPDFKAGMLFSSMKEIRAALKSYSIKERVKIHKTRNEPTRVDAVCLGKCEGGCSWFLKASMDSRTEAVVVRKYCGVHKCERVWELKALTAPFLTATFMDEFRDNHKMDLTTFATKIQRKFNMQPNRWKLRRARKEALLRIHGDEAEQFSLLWDYGQELRTSNPGSKFFLSTNKSTEQGVVKEHLATLYWSYDACKRGFLEGCRPIICIDGCHIKTRYKGVLLTAVGVDPNDCIYPIAMGVTEVECTSSWEWFLTTLKDDLNITNSSHFTIMSDRQKGLINAVKTVFPDAEHRYCVRHLYENFNKKHKGETLKKDLWAIARSCNIPTWRKHMDILEADSKEALNWVEELDQNTWIKAFFKDFSKCDMLLNNHFEVFNSYILDAREMPMLSMLENIFYKILHRIVTKQNEVETWHGKICPKIKKKLDKATEWAANSDVMSAGGGLYKVASSEFEGGYCVDLKAMTCDCRRWQLTGIPCWHAIACCRTDRINPETLVHSCYSIETYKKAYAHNMAPLRARCHWEKQNAVRVHPPLFTKVLGRPKKNRRKTPEEVEKNGAKSITRAGVVMHCSLCKKAGHNKKGHAKYMLEQNNGTAIVEDENGDRDNPAILEHIFPQRTNPAMDPSLQVQSMVYRMGEEERAHVPQSRGNGPLPEESAFVAAARKALPQPRVTTAMARGRATSSARGRGRGRTSTSEVEGEAAQQPATGRGRGRRNKRSAEGSSSQPANTTTRPRNSYPTGPGSAYHMLFGPNQQQQQQQQQNPQVNVPDLNEAAPEEIHTTQDAPLAF